MLEWLAKLGKYGLVYVWDSIYANFNVLAGLVICLGKYGLDIIVWVALKYSSIASVYFGKVCLNGLPV